MTETIGLVNNMDLSDLRYYTPDDLCKLLEGLDFSEHGMKALRNNHITGCWFVDFDENDIKDLFIGFKDRFLVRKILTRFRAQLSENQRTAATAATETDSVNNNNNNNNNNHTSNVNNNNNHNNNNSKSNNNKRRKSIVLSSKDPVLPMATLQGSQRRKAMKVEHVVAQRNDETIFANNLQQRSAVNNGDRFTAFGDDEMLEFCNDDFYANDNECQTDSNCLQQQTPGDYNELKDSEAESPPLPVGESTDESNCLMDILGSASYDDEEHEEEEEYTTNGSPVFLYPCPYSFDDLMERKPKTGSATPATHYFLAVLRHAATETGLWGPAPPMKDIPPNQRDAFISAMAKRVPGIETYQSEIFKRLAMALQNRRKYKRERRRIGAIKQELSALEQDC